MMNRQTLALFVVVSLFALMAVADDSAPRTKPNIVVILADDLGYGDVGCYNAESKVPTPNLDRLAREGIRFTDAHSASTVCTPSRYSLMTGRMCFRTGYRGGVFSGAGGPSLIEKDRVTLPRMLRDQGYATGCVGKWHIGLTFQTHDGKPVHEAKVDGNARELARVKLIDFTKPITDGPVHRGFDFFFGELMATCAAITGAKLSANAAEDSFSFLPALTGAPSTTPQREFTLHQTISLTMAIRRGDWKYLDHRGDC